MVPTIRKKDEHSMQKIHEMRMIRAKKNNAERSRLRKRYGLILTAAESSFVESVYPGRR